jgi:hypothetical protein
MRRGHYTPPEPPKKPKLVELTGDLLAELIAEDHGLSAPRLIREPKSPHIYVDADELRAWREARSQNTSGEAK